MYGNNFFISLIMFPFLAARAISLIILTFTLFSIFKKWNTGNNKELFNCLLLSNVFLILSSIFIFILSKMSYYYRFDFNDLIMIFLSLVITIIIFAIVNRSNNKIYPDEYFSNISDTDFLKMELTNSINVLMSIFNSSKNEYQEKSNAKKSQKFEAYKNNSSYSYQNKENSYTDYNYYGNDLGPAPFRGYIKDDWSFLLFIIFSFLTCGIYHWYFIYRVAQMANITCDGDGENTGGLLKFVVFGTLTCGIYCLFWEFNVMNRLQANAPRYRRFTQDGGASFLLWLIIGSWFCGIGAFVAWSLMIKNVNLLAKAYNIAHANEN